MLPILQTTIPGPKSRELAAALAAVECQNTIYADAEWPIFWDRAHGSNVWDADGNCFLDLTSAFGVATLGHAFSAPALASQATQLVHAMGDVHPAMQKVALCEQLSALTFERWNLGKGKSLLGNSGSDAVEAALKTARLASGRASVACFHGAYHGLGYGALLGAGIPWFREPFSAQLAPISHLLPYPAEGKPDTWNDFLQALENLPNAEIGAILVEPIQGRGGIVVPPAAFLLTLRRWCDDHGAVLIFDEIFTGFHRAGSMFAHESLAPGTHPDLICLGKSLSGGFPISACVGSAAVMDSWPKSHGEALHTSTFLGNPLGCAMALASLAEMQQAQTFSRAKKAAECWKNALQTALNDAPHVTEIRGRGLMWGIELREKSGNPATELCIQLVKNLLKVGLIALPDAPEGHVLALTPPLTLTPEEITFSAQAIALELRRLTSR